MRLFRLRGNQNSVKKKHFKRVGTRAFALLPILLLTLIAGCNTTPANQSATTANPPNPTSQTTPRSTRNPMSDLFSSDDDTSNGGNLVENDPIWQRLRDGFQLDRHTDGVQVEKELSWYRTHPAYVYKVTQRSERYLHYIAAAVEQRNMPAELALLPFIESAYDPFALSRSGASGLWQFIPGTGKKFGLHQTDWFDGRRDVIASTDAALDYLQFLHDKFDGDWLLAVAAYNCGEGTIQRAIEHNRRLGKPTDFWNLSIRDEPRTYVPRLLALSRIVADPRRYGITLYHVPNRAYFAAVNTYGALDLNKAANLAGVSVDEMRKLNPGLRRLATHPQGPHKILVPANAADRFSQQLAQTPPGQRFSNQDYQDYRVAAGDTLLSISRQFAVDPAAIASVNRLGGNNVGVGQLLLIPGGRTPTAAVAPPLAASTVGAANTTHTVAVGETLWQISKRYGVKAADIQRWNSLGSNSLRPGQRLTIAATTKPTTVAAASAAKAPQDNASDSTPAQKVGYTVKGGDSLFGIATKFNIEIEDILRWNQVNPRSLRAGQKLTLYVPQTLTAN
ncbi:MAG: LysM peptidoglycan-binding domain-containing protein [Spongiibacteraceae bacterium]